MKVQECLMGWQVGASDARGTEAGWVSLTFDLKGLLPLEGLMLKVKLQYFGPLMQRADSLDKTLILGQIEGKRRSG